MYFVGVMSGTSCDGIDVALLDFSSGITTIATEFQEYPNEVRAQLQNIINQQPITMAQLSQLDAKLGQLYAQSVNQFLYQQELTKYDIKAIGLHGQTIHHEPFGENPNTWQIGSAANVAKQTGIITIANFRQMDVAYGGQGAPLAPIFHQQLFSNVNKPIVVLNLGGIANITVVDSEKVLGFDTGPANCLMDEWIKKNQGHDYDENGEWAKRGQVNQKLLDCLLKEPYFHHAYPKSTGRELFNLEWLCSHELVDDLKDVDVQSTLLALTVKSIAMGIKQINKEVSEVIVCGGGAHNQTLLEELCKETNLPVKSSQDYGVDPNYVEATLMAWLAKQNIENKQLDFTDITGVPTPLVYGVCYVPKVDYPL